MNASGLMDAGRMSSKSSSSGRASKRSLSPGLSGSVPGWARVAVGVWFIDGMRGHGRIRTDRIHGTIRDRLNEFERPGVFRAFSFWNFRFVLDGDVDLDSDLDSDLGTDSGFVESDSNGLESVPESSGAEHDLRLGPAFKGRPLEFEILEVGRHRGGSIRPGQRGKVADSKGKSAIRGLLLNPSKRPGDCVDRASPRVSRGRPEPTQAIPGRTASRLSEDAHRRFSRIGFSRRHWILVFRPDA